MPPLTFANAGATVSPAHATRYRLFISYAHDDQSVDGPYAGKHYRCGPYEVPGVVGRFLQCLQGCLITLQVGLGQGGRNFGTEVFFDTARLTAGEKWVEKIQSALKECDALILLIGPGFVNSQFCLNEEVAVARQWGKAICPVVLRAVGPGWAKLPILGCNEVLGDFHALPHREQKLLAVESWSRPEEAFAELEIGLSQFLLQEVYTASAPVQPQTATSMPQGQPLGIHSAKSLLPVTYLCDQEKSFEVLKTVGSDWGDASDKALLLSLRLLPEDEWVYVLHRVRLKALPRSRNVSPFPCDPIEWPLLDTLPHEWPMAWGQALVNALKGDGSFSRRRDVQEQIAEGLSHHAQTHVLVLLMPPEAHEQPQRAQDMLQGLIDLLESFDSVQAVAGRLVILLVDPEAQADRCWLGAMGGRVYRNVMVAEPSGLQRFGLAHVKDWHRRHAALAPPGVAFPALQALAAWFNEVEAPTSGAAVPASLVSRFKRLWGGAPAQVGQPVTMSLGQFHTAFEKAHPGANFKV